MTILDRDDIFVITNILTSSDDLTMPPASSDRQLNRMFRAFSDSTRLRILHLLRYGELCVGDIVGALNELQPKVSRHLGYLKRAGLVEARRSGRWLFYSVNPPQTPFHRNLLACLAQCFSEVPELQADLRRAGIVQQAGGCCPEESTGEVQLALECSSPTKRRSRHKKASRT